MAEQQRADAGDPARFALKPEELRVVCDPATLGFADTSTLAAPGETIGQDRALAALRLGVGIRNSSWHLFAMGPAGVGKMTAVRAFLREAAAQRDAPSDWVHVYNFSKAHEPLAIQLARGRANGFAKAMLDAVEELRSAIPAVFESEGYQSRRSAIDEEVQASQESAFEALNKDAEARNIAILRTPVGFAMAPIRDGKVIKPQEFEALPQEERDRVQADIEALQQRLEQILKRIPTVEKERRKRVRELNEEVARSAVTTALDEVEKEFGTNEAIARHLSAVRDDMVANALAFLGDAHGEGEAMAPRANAESDARFRRYLVNVMVAGGGGDGAPVLEEDNPTMANLVGRIEHISQMGALVTDFLLIKPGALHKANGGYLLLDARKLLMQPFAWESLKRALKSGQIRIESAAEQFSLVTTVSLQPDTIPLDVKCVLFGDRMLYYLLSEYDPEFTELFKAAVDFDSETQRDAETISGFARLAASIAAGRALRPFEAGAVARLADESSRHAGDRTKLSLDVERLGELMSEADYWAGLHSSAQVRAEDVEQAVRQSEYRASRIREKALESMLREIVLVGTSGEAVGCINGLSVYQLGPVAFGRPARITATVRMGSGRIVDIEREVELGGPIHSKGVFILRGFLEGRYVREEALSLSANLAFEQSYGGIDGDSASCAELYALLSALSGAPIRQSLAVTGSVNQHGEVQAIGGVNEKIEGFFELCEKRGLDGRQGVLIPRANREHLMLRAEVVDAVRAGKFQVHAVGHVDEGIEILTGIAAGSRDAAGEWSPGSINARVEERLAAFAAARARYGGIGSGKPGEEGKKPE
jgi:predicted ATP-dependent protease